ncbi:hypothetical protein HY969_01020 [Candidatus Kaiserbacteria bacterium]|nr:hypothetical protein [Candidatus Kaiserbacteria bacterium]
MKKAVVTGSETFGKYITNPTKWLALAADGKVVADREIHSLVFPSVVLIPQGGENPGETVVKKAQEIGADMIISFGMASDVKGFRIERSGWNWVLNEKYLTVENNRPLDPSRPEKEQVQTDPTQWDIEKMQRLFSEAKIPFDAKLSDDAGRYSCNSWIYRTLVELRKTNSPIAYLFVHTACTENAIEFIPDFDRKNKVLVKNEDLLKALEIIIESQRR